MEILIVAVVIVGVVAVLNLLLTFGLVGKVRLLQERTAGLDATIPPVGTQIGSFEVTATDGATISERSLADGSTLVAFLSPTCRNCHELAEDLLNNAPAQPLIAFVDESFKREEAQQLAVRLSSAARVALIESEGPVSWAFRVKAFPVLALVRDGVVAASGHRRSAVAGHQAAEQTS